MLDRNKRQTFSTVGELQLLLGQLPAQTQVSICGTGGGFYHEEHDGSGICLDSEDLEDFYNEQ